MGTYENYIGYMARIISKRIAEYKKDVNEAKCNTALASRTVSHHVDILWDNTRIVKQVEPEKEKIVEVTKIYETKKGHYVLDPTLINNTWKWCEKNKKPATNNNIH